MNGAFQGVCHELLVQTAQNTKPALYDAVLIDEAQDMPPELFRLVHRFTKAPKRIIWAYDELQTLSEAVMPSAEALFGTNAAGEPLVTIRNETGRPRQDVILPVCYRNTPWALTLAHALGFGVYRHSKLVQHFDDPYLWTEIGYETLEGSLSLGSEVRLQRAKTSYPAFFEQLLTPDDAVVACGFGDEIEQAEWIAESVGKRGQTTFYRIAVMLKKVVCPRFLRRFLRDLGASSRSRLSTGLCIEGQKALSLPARKK